MYTTTYTQMYTRACWHARTRKRIQKIYNLQRQICVHTSIYSHMYIYTYVYSLSKPDVSLAFYSNQYAAQRCVTHILI